MSLTMRHTRCTRIVFAAALLLSSTLMAQSLGDVARTSRASKKASSRVTTNDNLPQSTQAGEGAVNGVVKAAGKERIPDAETSQAKKPAAPANQSNSQDELKEEVSTLKRQIAGVRGRMEGEENEATRAAMQQLLMKYQSHLSQAEQKLEGAK